MSATNLNEKTYVYAILDGSFISSLVSGSKVAVLKLKRISTMKNTSTPIIVPSYYFVSENGGSNATTNGISRQIARATKSANISQINLTLELGLNTNGG